VSCFTYIYIYIYIYLLLDIYRDLEGLEGAEMLHVEGRLARRILSQLQEPVAQDNLLKPGVGIREKWREGGREGWMDG